MLELNMEEYEEEWTDREEQKIIWGRKSLNIVKKKDLLEYKDIDIRSSA